MKTRLPAIAAMLITVVLLAACNTFAGVGEDITGAARSVQRSM